MFRLLDDATDNVKVCDPLVGLKREVFKVCRYKGGLGSVCAMVGLREEGLQENGGWCSGCAVADLREEGCK